MESRREPADGSDRSQAGSCDVLADNGLSPVLAAEPCAVAMLHSHFGHSRQLHIWQRKLLIRQGKSPDQSRAQVNLS